MDPLIVIGNEVMARDGEDLSRANDVWRFYGSPLGSHSEKPGILFEHFLRVRAELDFKPFYLVLSLSNKPRARQGLVVSLGLVGFLQRVGLTWFCIPFQPNP